MRSKLEILKNSTFDEINSTSKVLVLMDFYSKVYLAEQPVGGCESCLRNFYSEIMRTGEERLSLYEEIKSRTLIPNWIGVRNESGAFYNSETITDKMAINALKRGYLKESNFKKLPSGYTSSQTIENEIVENKEVATKRGRKKK